MYEVGHETEWPGRASETYESGIRGAAERPRCCSDWRGARLDGRSLEAAGGIARRRGVAA